MMPVAYGYLNLPTAPDGDAETLLAGASHELALLAAREGCRLPA